MRPLRASDAPGILEVVYDLDAEDEVWLAAIEGATRHLLAGDLGMVAADHEILPPEGGGLALRNFAAGRPELRVFFERAAALAPAEEVERVLSRTPIVCAFSESMELSGQPDFWDGVGHASFPIADLSGLWVKDGGRRTLGVMGVHTRRCDVRPVHRKSWMRVAIHLATVFRLRRALEGVPFQLELGEALIEPSGAIAHARGPARHRRERLRALVRTMERARTRRGSAEGTLWEPLVDGRWTLIDRFDSDGRRYYVALRNDPVPPSGPKLSPTERLVASMAASCLSNAEIGYSLDRSESVVATHLSCAMRKMGVVDRGDLPCLFQETARAVGPPELGIHSASSGLRAPPELTPAEAEVALAAAEGLTDAEIAALRGTSSRTVSNLLRRVFTKLDIASRYALRDRLRP